mgnify:CR=1 FL=1
MIDEALDPQAALEVEDRGDCVWYRMPNGFIADEGYPGSDAIYFPALALVAA